MAPLARTALLVAATLLALPSAACSDAGSPTAGSAPSPAATPALSAPAGSAPAPPTTSAPAGTGPTSVPEPQEGSVPAGGLVSVTRSGGLIGATETVIVHGDGRWDYTTDRNSRKPASGQLTAAERDRLSVLLARFATDRERSAPTEQGKCADGYAYRVQAAGAAARWSACGLGGPPPAAMSIVLLVGEATPL
jgi:hypothetical protein